MCMGVCLYVGIQAVSSSPSVCFLCVVFSLKLHARRTASLAYLTGH